MKRNLFNEGSFVTRTRHGKSLDEFVDQMRSDKPTEIFCWPWSRDRPLYVLSRHTKAGCRFICNARADQTPQWVPYKGLYKIMRNGLSESYYTVSAESRDTVGQTNEDL